MLLYITGLNGFYIYIQDFLNMFFRDVYMPIPNVYNLVVAMLWRHPANVEVGKAKVVNYCAAGSQPWRYTGEEENTDREDIKMLVKKWWDIYNDQSLDNKNNTVCVNGEAEATKFKLKPVPTHLYITAPSAA